MTAGSDIAAEIAAALIEAGEPATLEKPGPAGGTAANPTPGAPTKTTLTVFDEQKIARDAIGNIGQMFHKLMVSAVDAAPEKGDRIAVGYRHTDTIPVGAWVPVEEVAESKLNSDTLLYEVILAS